MTPVSWESRDISFLCAVFSVGLCEWIISRVFMGLDCESSLSSEFVFWYLTMTSGCRWDTSFSFHFESRLIDDTPTHKEGERKIRYQYQRCPTEKMENHRVKFLAHVIILQEIDENPAPFGGAMKLPPFQIHCYGLKRRETKRGGPISVLLLL